MPSSPTPTLLRYTLECRALPWQVLHFEESTSLARPPSMVLDVTTDRPLTELAEVERSTASLLIEGPELSRVVRGWVRYVEHIGVVDSRAHLRLHLVPMAMAENGPTRSLEAPAAPPVMLAPSPAERPAEPEWAAEPELVATPRFVEPPPLGEQDVTAEHTPEELRAMRGEDAEDEVRRPPMDRPSNERRREVTEDTWRNDGQGPAPKRRKSTEDDTAAHGIRLVTHAELHATLGNRRDEDGPQRRDPAADRRRSFPQTPVRTGGTQLMSQEELERLAAGVPARDGKPARSDARRLAEPSPPSAHEDRTEELPLPKAVTETERLRPLPATLPSGRRKPPATETERLKLASGANDDEQPPRREARDDQPERRRSKKRKADDQTSQMTWEEIEALHRDRGKPKP